MRVLIALHVIHFIVYSCGERTTPASVHIEKLPIGRGEDYVRNEDSALWWLLIGVVFQNAKGIQVVHLPSSDDAEVNLWPELVASIHRRLNVPVSVWDATRSRGFVHDVSHNPYHGKNLDNEEGRYFLLLIGEHFLDHLAYVNIWFPQGNYVVLVETGNQVESDPCSRNFSYITRQLWNAHRVPYACLLLSTCFKYAFMFEPYVGNGSDVVINADNVTDVIPLWNRAFSDMHNFTWKVALFPRYPTSLQVPNSRQKRTDFEGLDGYFLEAITEHYNMWPVIVDIPDTQLFGDYEGGNATGSLGVVLRGEADIAMNGRFIMDYGTNDVALTIPYTTDKLCVMAPPSERIPSYTAMYRSFDISTWIVLLVTFIVSSWAWGVIARGFDHRGTMRNYPRSVATRDVYFIMFAGIIVSQVAPRTLPARIMIASCLIFSVVFMNAFQALTYKSMKWPMFYPEIQTLEDVDRSGLPIITATRSLKEVFPADENDLMRSLRSKVVVVHGADEWARLTVDPSKYTSLSRYNGAAQQLRQYKMNRHLVEECPRTYFLSFVLQKKSPFLDLVNAFIVRCSDHGLLQFWEDKTFRPGGEHLRQRKSRDPHVSIGISQAQAPFIQLCVGLAFSILVFVFERVGKPWGLRNKRANVQKARIGAKPISNGVCLHAPIQPKYIIERHLLQKSEDGYYAFLD